MYTYIYMYIPDHFISLIFSYILPGKYIYIYKNERNKIIRFFLVIHKFFCFVCIIRVFLKPCYKIFRGRHSEYYQVHFWTSVS